jgi:hypothetical protein
MHVFLIFIGVHEIAALSWSFCIKAKGRKKKIKTTVRKITQIRETQDHFLAFTSQFL